MHDGRNLQEEQERGKKRETNKHKHSSASA
jgi:hypothetical protein